MERRWVLACLLLVSSVPASAFFGTPTDHQLLLTSENTREVREGAESVYDRYGANQQLLDIAAQRLHLEIEGSSSALSDDAVAWLAKAVGGSGSNRYQALLERVREKGSGKSRSWAKLGLRRAGKDAEPWNPDLIHVEAVREDALAKVPDLNLELQQRLQLTNHRLVRQPAERAYYLAGYLEKSTLKQVRGLLATEYLTEDKELRMALSWICRLLGRVGSSSDIELLTRVAKEAPSKLDDHARDAVRELKRKTT